MSLVLNKHSIGGDSSYRRISVLDGEVKEAKLYYHRMNNSEKYVSESCENVVTIFFLLSGNVSFCTKKAKYSFSEKAVYINLPQEEVEIQTHMDSEIIEVKWPKLGPLDSNKFPYAQNYINATQYRDACKSEKSISRMLIDWDLIPGFALGSVETEGFDIVSKHCHPDKDQIFFSFDENSVKLLIDEDEEAYEHNCFVHIPLGSNHGVKVETGNKAHYLWMDFDVLGEIKR
jgi:hypothetical protein